MKTLWPHQADALAYARKRDRIALFMQQRCGKTLVAIRWAKEKVPTGVVLVVGSIEVLDDWADELREDGETRIVMARGLSAAHRRPFLQGLTPPRSGRLWVLTNYEQLRGEKGIYRTLSVGGVLECIIADESTKIRNPQSATTKAAIHVGRLIPKRAILTGLPNPEGMTDYFSQFVFLKGEFEGYDNYWLWRNTRFFQPLTARGDTMSWLWSPKKEAISAIRKEVNRTAFVLTRKKAKIGGSKLYNRWAVPASAEQVRAIKQVSRSFEFDGHTTVWATVRDTWLARIAGGFLPEKGPLDPDTGEPTTVYRAIPCGKTAVLVEHLKGDLRDQSTIVWFRFNDELRAVSTALSAAGVAHQWINGATPRPRRLEVRKAFQAEAFPVLLMQVRVGMFGLNLSVADTAIYYSNPYDLEIRAQSEDRIIHGTKTHAVQCIDIVTKGSLDVVISDMLRQKWRDSRQFQMEMASRWSEFFRQEYGGGR
ncbi:MAG: DEAD/DEAH box helicase [Hyphomicrobiaceae bacterium]|nr:MAG: DEAD/DEAH box helicase [Hyphomicrobiaceae bacterium]